MGDMADYALEQVMDAEDDRFSYRMGGMSDAMAYDLGIIDSRGAESYRPMFKRISVAKQCKHCGLGGLHWKQVGSGWRLASPDGKIHSCANHRFS